MHEADLHFMLIKAAELSDDSKRPRITKKHFADATFSALAAKLGLPERRPYVVLAPGAAFGAAKRWPPEKFAALADLLSAQTDLTIVATGSRSEADIINNMQNNTKTGMINAAGQTSIHELACLLSRARVLIANDSGTMHLAALYATPTVVPVGPTDMARTGPLNKNFIPVMAEEVCPIAPCRQRLCSRHDHICMNGIAPQNIMTAVNQLLSRTDES